MHERELVDEAACSTLIGRVHPGARVIGVERLTGGVSADVHRIDLVLADGRSVRRVLRVHGETHGGHPADVEFALLEALHRLGVPVPRPLWVDARRELLPAPFLVLEFVAGVTSLPGGGSALHVARMADALASIHASATAGLPDLPARVDPMPEVFELLPDGPEWADLAERLRRVPDGAYAGPRRLLHGDFWPGNLVWRDDRIVAVLDWEDAALGDPVSDVAVCQLELRYVLGTSAARAFADAYERHFTIDRRRLAAWQIHVAAAAQHFMGRWGLEAGREARMRREALASLREGATRLAELPSFPSGREDPGP